jgi:thiosulfate reductase cytochrome b subunit
MRTRSVGRLSLVFLAALSAGLLLAAARLARAQSGAPAAVPAAPLHPVFALLDEDGANVLASGGAVSTLATCGQCHDAAYITQHNFHADLGLSALGAAEQTGGADWDASTGPFGEWSPLTYRYLTLVGDARLDLSTPDWVRLFSARHVGGGPAALARDGRPLTALAPDAANPETAVLDAATGRPVAWDWQVSGVVEVNCFLCHLAQPNNAARIATLEAGEFRWANTATLLGTGLVTRTAALGWQWNPAAFDAAGQLLPEQVGVQDPADTNCAQCHGQAHNSGQPPVTVTGCALDDWQTATTGQIVSPDRIAASGLNLSGKDTLIRAWDVHAERGVQCTDCHYALNNPAYDATGQAEAPDHLVFDPRRLDVGEFLQRPNHDLARSTRAPAPARGCESCHDAAAAHSTLPYEERHLAVLACETCHVPRAYAPAIQSIDWTALDSAGEPLTACRGTTEIGGAAALISGFEPALLPDADGALAPYNLVTAWYWVYDDAGGSPRPVPLADLQATWLGGSHAPEVVAVLDADKSGALEASELVLDTPAKQAAIAQRLAARGLANPRIAGSVEAYRLSHTITSGEWAVAECQACHGDASRLAAPMVLAAARPGGVAPSLTGAAAAAGGAVVDEGGALRYEPDPGAQGLYVFGRDRVGLIDGLGAVAFVGVLAAVLAHGGLRFAAALRAQRAQRVPRGAPRLQRVYMYAMYERFWHWLQTAAIVLLLFTGLIIHRPDTFGIFSFRHVVVVHNVLAAILVINAALSLFYHLASGEIRQYLPRPYGFFDQAIVQAKYYLRGIFRAAPHPFEKSPRRKLNPLQQFTYLGILNVLLPLQILTGALMWGAQRWPQWAEPLGGLPVLAPVHSLVAWLFASFIVAHVYLTTTGHGPLASIRAMIDGWDILETHAPAAQEITAHDHTEPGPPAGPAAEAAAGAAGAAD